MAYGTPTYGEPGEIYTDKVRNSLDYVKGAAEAAQATADNAVQSLIATSQTADEAKEIALAARGYLETPTDGRMAEHINDTASQTSAALSASYVAPSAMAAGPTVDPTGTTDSTAAIQAAIDACDVGGTLWIPNGTYKISAPLVVTKSMTITGESSSDGWLPLSLGGSLDTAAEMFKGVVIKQTAAAADILQLSGSATSVNLHNLGLAFEGGHQFTNTGHGVNATPSTTRTFEGRTGLDHGIVSAQWSNVRVFGHDGNHYAFKMVNTLECTLENIKGYGGGGLQVLTDSPQGNYGNLVVVHPYMNLFCAGTAHGYHFEGQTSGGNYGVLGLIAMIRPQCNATDVSARYPASTPPTTDQYTFRAGGNGMPVSPMTIIAPDFESPLGLTFSAGSGNHFIDGAGLGIPQTVTYRAAVNNTGFSVINAEGNAQTVAKINTAGNAIVGDANLVDLTDTLVLTGATKRLYLRCGSTNYITLDPVADGVKMEKRLWLSGHTVETTAPAAGAAAALPATPAGYVVININGTNRRIAYY